MASPVSMISSWSASCSLKRKTLLAFSDSTPTMPLKST